MYPQLCQLCVGYRGCTHRDAGVAHTFMPMYSLLIFRLSAIYATATTLAWGHVFNRLLQSCNDVNARTVACRTLCLHSSLQTRLAYPRAQCIAQYDWRMIVRLLSGRQPYKPGQALVRIV